MTNQRVLLAGCGDLGLRIARSLYAQGDDVWALRRQPPAHADGGIHWLAADLTEPDSLRELPRGITQLVYLPTPDRRDHTAYHAIFVEGLRHLLGALDGAAMQRVIFVSSTAVYGDHAGAWIDETTPTAPPGFNGAALLEAEQWLAEQPINSTVLRLAGLYGPGRLQLLDRLRAGAVRVPREQPHWANRIHIDDAAAAVVHLLGLSDPQPLYLGADDTPLPLDQLYDQLARLIGVPVPMAGCAPAGVGSKRIRNARLVASGFDLRWPDSREGYAALMGV